MSVKIKLDLTGLNSAQLAELEEAMADRAGLNAEVAAGAESFLKAKGAEKAAATHGSANRLGAKPTGHLEKAYQDITAESNAEGAYLLIPSDSRLRAAFGPYSLDTPTATGKEYYTIPVSGAAYGRRAGEFTDLFPLRVGPRQTPILARDLGGGRLETMYLLTKHIDVEEDPTLIPFDALLEEASTRAEQWHDALVEKLLATAAA